VSDEPDGARVGDRVLVTKGPAVEATGLLAFQFEAPCVPRPTTTSRTTRPTASTTCRP
jgi:hypothetical protein